jgi:hypothetical protein
MLLADLAMAFHVPAATSYISETLAETGSQQPDATFSDGN